MSESSGAAKEIVFRIDGARFDEMAMSRVAKYMKHLAGIAGQDVVFVRMTHNEIVFRPADNVTQAHK